MALEIKSETLVIGVGVEFEVAGFEVGGWVVSQLGWVEVGLGLGQARVGRLKPAGVA